MKRGLSMLGGQSFGDAVLVAELISGAAGAAEAALAEIYHRHGSAVFGFAARCTGDERRAEHVTEKVFAELWAQPDAFELSQGSLRPSLTKAAYRHCVGIRLYEEHEERADDEAEAQPWRQLPDEDRWAIGLTHFGEMNAKEVAVVLGVSEEVVQSRITRGLRRLRR